MNDFWWPSSGCGKLILLAPSLPPKCNFEDFRIDPTQHRRLLDEAQRLRGRVYLNDGAVTARQLTPDDRLVHPHDDRSWHLLIVNDAQDVAGCIRYSSQEEASFSDLGVAHSALAKSATWGRRLREAVEDLRADARERGIGYAEVGGWALIEDLRYSREALRITLHVYGLMKFLGGALAIATATLRHNSSIILRKLGGHGLVSAGEPLPRYYEPLYECDMEILGFDSERPASKYEDRVRECCDNLCNVPVFCAATESEAWAIDPEEALVTA